MAPPIKAAKKFMEAMAAYENNLRAIGRSENTIATEDYIFKIFSGFLLENDMWDHEEGFLEIQAWRDHLVRTGKKPSTVQQYLSTLSAFYRFASSEQLGDARWYDRNPVAPMLKPDTRKIQKRPYDQLLTDDQVILLWRNNRPRDYKRPDLWARNYAIVVLLLSTAIRNSELLALTPNDLSFEDSELVVERGKGNKFRVVDFPLVAQTAVKLYLASGVRPKSAAGSDPLFGTQAQSQFSGNNNVGCEWHAGTRQWLSDVVKNHVRAVTGVDMIRSHDLRHVCARLDLNSGMSFEELQTKLGHESVATTQIYSGKLTSRKSRRKTKNVQEERDRQAQRNILKLTLQGDDFFKNLLPA